MRFFRFLLFPLTILYAIGISFRNFFYNIGIIKSMTPEVKTIGVGNLSVGGTGKSVVTDYLISLLKSDHQLATLSRGYGRKTKGFYLANADSTALEIGDEPLMFYKKHPEIKVGVAENRNKGISELMALDNPPNLVVLDDCYQHRRLNAHFYILLTTFHQPFFDDYLLPTGDLREFSSAKERADLVVVTKCPQQLTSTQRKAMTAQLRLSSKQTLCFANIQYATKMRNAQRDMSLSVLEKINFLLVTGIAQPDLLIDFLKSKFLKFKHLNFGDHHNFSAKDIAKIRRESQGHMILTTEKDYVRLYPVMKSDLLFYLPITLGFDGDDKALFDQAVANALHD